MIVMKFGGTSVGTPERIKSVARLVTRNDKPSFVVLSAMSGTTNALVEIANYLYKKNTDSAKEVINALEQKYREHIENLYDTKKYKERMHKFLDDEFSFLRSFTTDFFTSFEEKQIVAQGEIISTTMLENYFLENGVKAILLSALDFMRTDKNGEPAQGIIREGLSHLMEKNPDFDVYLTQGFICRNAYGEVDNLLRGGSDYTASLIGVALQSEEIQIWTDIDGIHNNDPRVVKHTEAVRQLNFEEASELAYFGAKILHPTCVQPAKNASVPVRLKNTMEPNAEGTLINNELMRGKLKAVAAKDNIVAIRVNSSRKLGSPDFLRKVFETFEGYQTAIDMIATSEVGVSMTIDNHSHLAEIVEELKKYGTVMVDEKMCIVCIVGDLDSANVGFENLATAALRNIPVRMISYGGSNYNISFLIHEDDKKQALESLSATIFSGKQEGDA